MTTKVRSSTLDTLSSATATDLYVNNLRANTSPSLVYGTWNLASGAVFQATYADLAERYVPDTEYTPGTVLVFGGDQEVTQSVSSNDTRVAGIVSTNPAYLLNSGIVGVDIALQGRVPCKVVGKIRKGDMLVTSAFPGVACAEDNPKVGTVIGKALENYESQEIGVIEVAVGRA
jgi:hypothetical protein